MTLRHRAPLFLEYSIDFEASSSQYMFSAWATATPKKWTFACWFKRETTSALQYLFAGGTDGNNESAVILSSTNHLAMFDFVAATHTSRVSDATSINDTDWHHACVRYDTDQLTAADRVRVYTDGVLATSFEFTPTYPSQGYSSGYINQVAGFSVGRNPSLASGYFDGLLSDVYFVDGESLDAGYFVDLPGGNAVPRHYHGPAFTNDSFWLEARTADIETDSSGLGNDLTPDAQSPTQSTTAPP